MRRHSILLYDKPQWRCPEVGHMTRERHAVIVIRVQHVEFAGVSFRSCRTGAFVRRHAMPIFHFSASRRRACMVTHNQCLKLTVVQRLAIFCAVRISPRSNLSSKHDPASPFHPSHLVALGLCTPPARKASALRAEPHPRSRNPKSGQTARRQNRRR